MANIEVTPLGRKGKRKVFVNSVEIPDVINVSMNVYPCELDTVSITIHADSFRATEAEIEQNQNRFEVRKCEK